MFLQRRFLLVLIIIMVSVLSTAALANEDKTEQAARTASTLFDDLGGEVVLKSITDDLVHKFATDAQIGHYFFHTNKTRLREKLYEQLCYVSDGPCEYTGDSMRETHRGHEIRHADFARVVELMRVVLDDHGVSDSAKNRLLKKLAPMKRDIVDS